MCVQSTLSGLYLENSQCNEDFYKASLLLFTILNFNCYRKSSHLWPICLFSVALLSLFKSAVLEFILDDSLKNITLNSLKLWCFQKYLKLTSI